MTPSYRSRRRWARAAFAAGLAASCLWNPPWPPSALAQETGPRGLRAPASQAPRRPGAPEPATVPSEVRDGAGLFSPEAVRAARENLQRMERTSGVPVLIETVESLRGEGVDAAASRLARQSGTQGVFILIARKDRKIEVLASRRYATTLPRTASNKVRSAFIEGLRREEFDRALKEGIAAIEVELKQAGTQGRLPHAEQPLASEASARRAELPGAAASITSARSGGGAADSPPGAEKPLIVRNQVRLTLDGARTIIAAAQREAESLGLRVNVAVVDDGGHLISFDRMNGARPASGYTAITKAATAATFRQATGPLPMGTANPDPLLNLSLQLAAQASGGKITTLLGGVPVLVDDQVIGGVGVGGGTGEQDSRVARAGIQALLDALTKPKAKPPSR